MSDESERIGQMYDINQDSTPQRHDLHERTIPRGYEGHSTRYFMSRVRPQELKNDVLEKQKQRLRLLSSKMSRPLNKNSVLGNLLSDNYYKR